MADLDQVLPHFALDPPVGLGTMSLLGRLMTCYAVADVKRDDQTLTLGISLRA